MTTPVYTVNELIQVAEAIDAHCKRVRLKSGAWLRADLRVVDIDREELGALQAQQTAAAFTEVRRDHKLGVILSTDCVEVEFERLRLIARAPERKPTDIERDAIERHGVQSARLPVQKA